MHSSQKKSDHFDHSNRVDHSIRVRSVLQLETKWRNALNKATAGTEVPRHVVASVHVLLLRQKNCVRHYVDATSAPLYMTPMTRNGKRLNASKLLRQAATPSSASTEHRRGEQRRMPPHVRIEPQRLVPVGRYRACAMAQPPRGTIRPEPRYPRVHHPIHIQERAGDA